MKRCSVATRLPRWNSAAPANPSKEAIHAREQACSNPARNSPLETPDRVRVEEVQFNRLIYGVGQDRAVPTSRAGGGLPSSPSVACSTIRRALRFAPGRPLTASFLGNIRHLQGRREETGPERELRPDSSGTRTSSIYSREYRLVTSFPGGNLSSCVHSMPSDLNNGTAENLSLLQRNASLVDLFQRISVGHQLP